MNSSKKLCTLARLCQREFSKSAVRTQTEAVNPRFNKLKAAQKKFQTDDHLPVFLKGGFADKILYQGTFLLALTGVGMSIHTFITLVLK